MLFENRSKYPFYVYRIVFTQIWQECLRQGFSSQDSREFAQLEWESLVEKSNNK